MAFDGFVISNIVSELNQQIIGGRIYKIYQPEADEITLVIKKERLTTRLLSQPVLPSLLSIYPRKEKQTLCKLQTSVCCFSKHISSGRIFDLTA